MALGEVVLMSTLNILVEMMLHVMMIAPSGVIGTVAIGGSAAGSVTGTRTESAGGPDPASAVDIPVHRSGRGRDRLQQERKVLVVAGVGSERGSVGGQPEETAGAGRGVETGKGGVGVGIVRERRKEARGWMGRRSVKETVPQRVGSGCRKNTKEKWVRAWRSVETGTEKGTETEGVVTEIETGAGETGTETGSTRGSVGREKEGNAKRSATALYETTWAPKMTWAMRMREEHHNIWRSTVRMG